jgi:hypothetical protein
VLTEEVRTYRAFISAGDPLGAEVEGVTAFVIERDGRRVRTEASGAFTCTRDEFRYDVSLDVRSDDEPLATRTWSGSVPRLLC